MARRNLLKGFKRPKGINFEHSEITADYGKFIAYPFERGFGTTVGNTLRRILISSLQGYAITAVRITSYAKDGKAHVISSGFEIIPGVAEDTPLLLGNLKQVKLVLNDESEEKTILVTKKGPGVFTAGDCRIGATMQLVTAVADGVNAAMMLKQYFRDPNWWNTAVSDALQPAGY